MGYDLHITRADFWAENEGREISTEEWSGLVESDPLLMFDTRNGPFFAVLESRGDGTPGWLDWNAGNITSKHPDRLTLRKMLEIAVHLDASVQGDDGERYESTDDLPDSSALPVTREQESGDAPRYLRREARWNWFMFALIALAVLAVNLID